MTGAAQALECTFEVVEGAQTLVGESVGADKDVRCGACTAQGNAGQQRRTERRGARLNQRKQRGRQTLPPVSRCSTCGARRQRGGDVLAEQVRVRGDVVEFGPAGRRDGPRQWTAARRCRRLSHSLRC